MRPKSILLLALALGCGLIASWGISDVMERNANRQQAPVEETEEIYVALKDINVNEALNPELVKLEKWPKVKVPRDAMRDLDELVGRRAGTKLYAGEPIISSRLVSANQSAAAQLPKGYRPFPIRVDAVTSAAGLIKPGDRVDVQLFVKRNPSLGIEETRTQTILSDIRVFAIDDQYQRGTGEEEGHVVASTVSLVVTVEQANKLSLASRIGEMSLMLRHPDDDEVADDSASVNELFGLDEGDREAEREAPQTAAEGILAKLNAMKEAAAQAAAAQPPVEEVIEAPHKLMLLRGNEVEVIEFPVDGSLPTPASAAKMTASPVSMPMTPDMRMSMPEVNAPAANSTEPMTTHSSEDSSDDSSTGGEDEAPIKMEDLEKLKLGLE